MTDSCKTFTDIMNDLLIATHQHLNKSVGVGNMTG